MSNKRTATSQPLIADEEPVVFLLLVRRGIVEKFPTARTQVVEPGEGHDRLHQGQSGQQGHNHLLDST